MVTPERNVPGISDSTWNKPIIKAVLYVMFYKGIMNKDLRYLCK